MNLKELREKLTKTLLAARAICDEADKAGRDFTAEERQKLEGHLSEAKGLKEQITKIEGDEELRKQFAGMGMGLTDGHQSGGDAQPAAGKGTIGE